MRAAARRMRRRLPALARAAQFAAARRLGRPVSACVAGLPFEMSPFDDGPGRALFVWRETPEFTVLPQALELLRARGAPRDGGVLVDVGANLGTTTILALDRYGFDRAIAIEPDPENVSFLRRNLERNGMQDRVDVVPAAAAAVSGSDVFKLGRPTGRGRRAGAGSLLAPRYLEVEGVVVQVVTVDEVLAERGIAPDEVRLLWLDVQGFEGHVVAGATQLVERSTPLVFASRPRKLARAGGLERLAELVAEHYDEIVDLRDPSATPAPAADLPAVMAGGATTDILAYARPA